MLNESLITQILNVRANYNASPKLAPGISRSLYPFDYNKNNPLSGFNDWGRYIREATKALTQKENRLGPGQILMREVYSILNSKKY